MTPAAYNAFCASLPHASHVVQWGGAHVWKVADKMFAIGWFEQAQEARITFKVSPMSYEVLKQTEGCIPAPYLASRGMTWIQRRSAKALSDQELQNYLRESHRLVALGLSKKKRIALGLA